MYLKDGSSYTGAVNTDGAAGSVYVELSGDSTWTLTGDSYITSLTCGTDNVKIKRTYALCKWNSLYRRNCL